MKRLAPALVALAFLPLLLPSASSAGDSELLVNGGFESGTTGWSWNDGTLLDTVGSPVHSGSASGRFAADGQPDTTVVVYQSADVIGGQSYEFGGWILLNDPDVTRVELRIHWFAPDGLIRFDVSPSSLTGTVPDFRYLATKPLTAPLAARSARVSVHVVPNGDFEIYLDDFSFVGPAPAPTPAPTTTAPPTPAATPPPPTTQTPAATVTPTPTPSPTSTASPPPTATNGPDETPLGEATPSNAPSPTAPPTTPELPKLGPTPPASATPTSTPATEPIAFSQLTNGSFEQIRADGTPYAWRKFGGSYGSTNTQSLDGNFSLGFTSSTESTKWVYQTIEVVGGAHYEASVYALKNNPGVKGLFLRVSFYASDDGSGRAISSVDSVDTLTNDDPGFRILTTETIQTPIEARTAKVRLMMRPASSEPTTSYFDSVSFRLMAAPPAVATPTKDPEIRQEPTDATPEVDAEEHPASDRDHETVPPSQYLAPGQYATVRPSAAVLGVESTPITFANVGAPQEGGDSGQPESSGSGYNFLLVLAVALPAIGLGAVGLYELRRS